MASLVSSCRIQSGTGEYAGSHPAPDGFYGAHDYGGTNVVLAWNRKQGPILGFVIGQNIFQTNTREYGCRKFYLSSNATFFVVTNGASCALPAMNFYTLAAIYPGGTLSGTDTWYESWHNENAQDGPPFGPPLVSEVTAKIDDSGTNVEIDWQSVPGPATNYIIVQATYDPTNGDGFDFSLIGTVGSNVSSFEAVGTVQNCNNLRDVYEVAALYPGNAFSAFVAAPVAPNLHALRTLARKGN